jgi:hypothetical protein
MAQGASTATIIILIENNINYVEILFKNLIIKLN